MISDFRFPIAAALLAFLCLVGPALAEETRKASPPAQVEWLAANSVALSTGAELARLPARLRDGRVILLGEVHGLAHGQLADFAMLKALHRQAGVRYYVGEFDAAQADAFNTYLNTGASEALEDVFRGWRARGLQWANDDFRDKLGAIARWNGKLPAGQRIRFLGADEVQDRPAFCRWLSGRMKALKAGAVHQRLAAALDDPASCPSAGPLAVEAAAQNSGLDPVTADGIAALAADSLHTDREARIEANFRRHLSTQHGRLYGLWGLGHVVKAAVNGTAPLALRLQRAGIRVSSIAMLNLGGEMMIPSQSKDGAIVYSTMPYTMDSAEAALVNGIEPFAALAKGPLTLFILAGRNSAFRNSDALTRVGGRFGKMQRFEIDPATALAGFWADGILISRGSPATRAYSGDNRPVRSTGN